MLISYFFYKFIVVFLTFSMIEYLFHSFLIIFTKNVFIFFSVYNMGNSHCYLIRKYDKY